MNKDPRYGKMVAVYLMVILIGVIAAALIITCSKMALAVGIPGRVVTGQVINVDVLDPCGVDGGMYGDEVYLRIGNTVLTVQGRSDFNFMDPQVYLRVVPNGAGLITRDGTNCHFLNNNGVLIEQ